MMKHIIFGLAIIIFISCKNENSNTTHKNNVPNKQEVEPPILDTQKIATKAAKALEFVASKNMSKEWCILIDMSLHSGIKRWVQWDFANKKIVSTAIVTHGCGKKKWAGDKSKIAPEFSNVPESHLSSLGRYKIGARGPSSWGIGVKYTLHGLDTSNNNAAARYVVLHSWEAVADESTFPKGAPESWGCPAVSDNYMRYIDEQLQKSKKPVLMWIFND